MFRNRYFLFGLVLTTAILFRLINIGTQSPWVDETFSLAMATGHSLEGEAIVPSDYTDSLIPLAAGHYLSFIKPAGGISGIISAVERSDTSPPLFYVALRAWMSIFGISVLSARLFALFLSLTALLCLYCLGNIISRETGIISSLLFALSPMTIYILSEIRMYGLLVTITILLILITYNIATDRNNKVNWLLWTTVSVCGFYTHYMFCSVFLAGNLFFLTTLFFNKKSISKKLWFLSTAISLLLFILFTPSVVRQFSSPRITSTWLNAHNSFWDLVKLLFSNMGNLAWSSNGNLFSSCAVLAFFIAGIFLVKKNNSSFAILLTLFFFVPLLFLFSMDLVRSTRQMGQIRYFVLATPPLFITLALCISYVSKTLKIVLILSLSLFLAVQSLFLISWKYNYWEPFHQTGDFINEKIEPNDLVLIRSIPSGVISLCLYLKEKTQVIALSRNPDSNIINGLLDSSFKASEGGIWFVTAHTNWSKEYQKTEIVINKHLRKKYKIKTLKTLGRGKGKIDITYFK